MDHVKEVIAKDCEGAKGTSGAKVLHTRGPICSFELTSKRAVLQPSRPSETYDRPVHESPVRQLRNPHVSAALCLSAQFFALRCNPRRHPSGTVGDNIPALSRANRAESG